MSAADTVPSDLLTGTFHGFSGLARQLAALDARLATICESQTPSIVAKARQIRRKLRDFEPGVTMIGQVKAGKTTLVNAMVGESGLLPADVNPWTSVVTSLHLRPGAQAAHGGASFTFFAEEEWQHLVQRGGRLGELAQRANADDELARVRTQLEAMREKSRRRLGQRFELLLGQTHDYDSFGSDLIERYVCLGDDFWEDAGSDGDRGRFADITRTADLWLTQPATPLALCVRDTPGVNDTFMIREQITINALRGSRLCVVVLAASQALTSVDLALIRMIANVESRDVIIFVNRIDELADPARDVPEIRDSIRETLRRHDGPTDAEIIFGCGHWASMAMAGGVEDLEKDSADALLKWADVTLGQDDAHRSVEATLWHLSGLDRLGRAIAARIEDGVGAQFLREIEIEIGNLDQNAAASDVLAEMATRSGRRCRMDHADLIRAFGELEARARSRLLSGLPPLQHGLVERSENLLQTFVQRATTALIEHLETYGDLEVWTYDPCGLRTLLRSGFQRYVRAVTRHAGTSFAAAAEDITEFYREAFDFDGGHPVLQPPPLPAPDPPVVLGQSIALDMSGTWWTRFWRLRRGYKAYAGDFARLIRGETQPMIDALVTENAQSFEAALNQTLEEFLSANRKIILDMAQGPAQAGATTAPGHRSAGHGATRPRHLSMS